nr:MAG: capsid protein [Chemarfal virus 194]
MHVYFKHLHRKFICMPKRKGSYASPASSPKKLVRFGQAIAAGVASATTKAVVTKVANAVSGASTSKSSTAQAIESKDSPSGRTYIYKAKSKKATKKAKKNQIKKTKFQNRVLAAVNHNQLGTKLFSFNEQFNSGAVAVDTQATHSFCAYGNVPVGAGISNGYRDLRRMLTADSMNDSGTIFTITSFWAKFTLVNQNVSQFYIDIYKITNRKNESDANRIGNIWANDLATSGTQTGAGAQTTGTLGQTPFQSPLTMQRFKVLEKVTVALGQNETYQFEVKNKRPFNYNSAKLDDYGWIAPTFSYLFIFYGRPTTTNAAAALAANSLSITCTRHYTYRRGVTGVNQPTDTANGGLAA